MSNQTPSSIDITNAISLAIAAGKAMQDKRDHAVTKDDEEAMGKLGLRFAELSLQLLGGEAGKVPGDEARGA